MRMKGVFRQTLVDTGRVFRAWALGCAFGAVALTLLVTHVAAPGWLRIAARLPMGLPLEASLAVWLDRIVLQLLVPPAICLFAIRAGSGLLAGPQEADELELLLTYPVRRSELALAKLGALSLWLAALAGLTGLFLWAGFNAAGAAVSVGLVSARLGEATLLALAAGALTMALGSRTGRRDIALTGGLVALIVAFVLEITWSLLPAWLAWARLLSPLVWSASGWILPLALLAAAMIALALSAFEQRELLG